MTVPKWLTPYLDSSAFDQVEASIAKAESRTSGEIIPIVIRKSSTVDHVSIIVLLACFTCLLLTNPAQFLNWEFAQWMVEALYGLISILAAPVISRPHRVQRALTSATDRDSQVRMRAEVEFYKAGLNHTDGQTGILIFVSMLEHQVVVLADKGIASKLPESTWQDVVALVTKGIKSKSLATGLCSGIEKCGELLESEFPIAHDDKNEIRDHLIILD